MNSEVRPHQHPLKKKFVESGSCSVGMKQYCGEKRLPRRMWTPCPLFCVILCNREVSVKYAPKSIEVVHLTL